MGKIVQLIANWYSFTADGGGEDYDTYEVGKNGVDKIIEYRPRGEGDKWFYDVHFEKKGTKRIFNPNSVSYSVESTP